MAEKKRSLWIIKKFFSPVKNNPRLIIKLFFIFCLWIIFPLITVEIFKRATTSIQNWEYEWIKKWVFVYLWFVIIRIVLWYLLKNVETNTINEIEKNIQWEYFKKYFKLDNTSIEKLWTGKMQSIISKWISTRKKLIQKITWNIPTILITRIYALVQIYQSLWIWYCIWFIILPFWVYFFIQYFNSFAVPLRKERSNKIAEYNRHLIKILMSKMEIVQNWKESFEIDKAHRILDENTEIKKKIIFYLWAIWETVRIFGYALNIFILLYWIHLVDIWWDLSIFVGLIVCSTIFTWAVEKFSNFYKEFTDDFTHIEKMRNTFDDIPNMKNKYSNIIFKYKKWDIKIDNISFSYNSKINVFDKFSLDISGWKKTAFVWESGSWKTTLVKLIAWYISPDRWKILIDCQNVGEVNIYDYFSHIWFLTQDPSVFDGTIYDNLIYALKYHPTDTKLKKVIMAAKCEFIYDFAEWLQTEIWEKWIRLSWWQKQRLAIAKIMLKNPDIILLDEPTSALDSFNEEEISQALNNLFKWKTVIIVAHRLQTVKSADRILLFENWKIIEDWTHQSLIRKNWKYKKMLDLQSGF